MKITFVRHFETPWNQAGKLQGSADIAIAPASKELIQSTLASMPTNIYDQVYVSPLMRTQQTAIALGYPEFQISEDLLEINFKEFEGQRKSDLLKFDNGIWRRSPFDSVLRDSLDELSERIDNFMQSLHSENILVIGHGAWLRLCYARYVLETPNEMNQVHSPNGWVWTLEI